MRVPKPERGQTLVEFALIAPIFILVLVGLFDFGRAVYYYSTANNAAREGARWAITDQTFQHIEERAATRGIGLGIDANDPADDGLITVDYRLPSTPDVAGSCDDRLGSDAVYGCLAVVTVRHNYTAATPMISALVGPIEITGEARFPVAFNCSEDAGAPACPIAE